MSLADQAFFLYDHLEGEAKKIKLSTGLALRGVILRL